MSTKRVFSKNEVLFAKKAASPAAVMLGNWLSGGANELDGLGKINVSHKKGLNVTTLLNEMKIS